jgi:hypothetical protein
MSSEAHCTRAVGLEVLCLRREITIRAGEEQILGDELIQCHGIRVDLGGPKPSFAPDDLLGQRTAGTGEDALKQHRIGIAHRAIHGGVR